MPNDGADVRADVFKRISERGKTMLSLTSSNLSLEQVFLRLTEVSDNNEARRMFGVDEVYSEPAEEEIDVKEEE